jgi:hypothetical protein
MPKENVHGAIGPDRGEREKFQARSGTIGGDLAGEEEQFRVGKLTGTIGHDPARLGWITLVPAPSDPSWEAQ